MPIPTLITDLSATAVSNSPAGSDTVFPDLDNYVRALSAFLASIRDNSGNGWVSPYATTSASSLTSGTLPDARFPATLPAASGVNLTALSASNLASGTVPDARFPATLPAASGVNLTALNASNLASGTVPAARITSVTATGAVMSTQSGSAPSYAARAWCRFDGSLTGTNAPTAGGNVSTVTRNSVGNYTVTFTTAMSSANYGVALQFAASSSNGSIFVNSGALPSTTALNIVTTDGAGALVDRANIWVTVTA